MIKQWIMLLCVLVVAIGCTGSASGDEVGALEFADMYFTVSSDIFDYNASDNSFRGDISAGDVTNTFTANYVSGYKPDNYKWELWKSGTLVSSPPVSSDNFTTYTFKKPASQYTLKVIGYNGTGPIDQRRQNMSSYTVYAQHPVDGVGYWWPNVSEFIPWEYSLAFFQSPSSAKIDSYRFVFGDSKSESSPSNWINHIYPAVYTKKVYSAKIIAQNTTGRINGVNNIYPDKIVDLTVETIPPPVANITIYKGGTFQKIDKGPVPLSVRFESNDQWDYPMIYDLMPDIGLRWVNWTEIYGYSEFDTFNKQIDPQSATFTTPGVYNVVHRVSCNFTNLSVYPNEPYQRGSFFGNHTSKQLIVYDPIIPDFKYDIGDCPSFPLTVTFTDNSTNKTTLIDKWRWDFNDLTPVQEVSTRSITHTYHIPGQYQVNMTPINTSYGIYDYSIVKPVDVYGLYANFTQKPESPIYTNRDEIVWVEFESTTEGTEGLTIQHLWEFEKDGRIINEIGPNATMSYSRNGTYNVSLTATSIGDTCKGITNTSRKSVVIREDLKTDFDYQQIYGEGKYRVQFNDRSTDAPIRWLWKFYKKNGVDYDTVLNNPNPVYEYPETGSYKVSLQVDNLQGHGRLKEKTITVTEDLKASFTANPSKGISPLWVQFTDTSKPTAGVITNLLWVFGDGQTNTTLNPLHKFEVLGDLDSKKFSVNLTVRNQTTGAIHTSPVQTIDVIRKPVANFEPNSTAPLYKDRGVTFRSTSQGNITTYLWEFGDGNTSIVPNPTNYYKDYGQYQVNLTVSNSYYPGSEDTKRVLLDVVDPRSPTIKFTVNPQDVDRNQDVQFTITDITGADPTATEWNFGDKSPIVIGADPKHRYSDPGIFTVTATARNIYGIGTDAKDVRVRGLIPDFDIVANGNWAFINTPVTFVDRSKGSPNKWLWDFGDGHTEYTEISDIKHFYAKVGTYSVTMTATNWQPISATTLPKQITIVEKTTPKDVKFEVPLKEQVVKVGEKVFFEDQTPDQNNITAWLWEFGDGSNSVERAPSHTYTKPGQYTVVLTVRNDAGTAEARQVAYIVVL